MGVQTQIMTLVYNILFGGDQADHEKIDALSSDINQEEEFKFGWFQMPIHYPRYKKGDYEKMEEWRLDNLLQQYGLLAFLNSSLEEKRAYAIGTFLWPDQQ